MERTWENRDPETGEHDRNGHRILLVDISWQCSKCKHYFDAAVDADAFACGESCERAHQIMTNIVELQVEDFVRKPVPVQAVQVTDVNFELVAEWCGGEVQFTTPKNQGDRRYVQRRYVRVDVQRPLGERQTMAFPGDWILKAGTGYKVYTNEAFWKAFEEYEPADD